VSNWFIRFKSKKLAYFNIKDDIPDIRVRCKIVVYNLNLSSQNISFVTSSLTWVEHLRHDYFIQSSKLF